MREKNTKIEKSIFRIVICSIGGVVTIFGFILCFGALLKLPDDISKNVTIFFSGVLVLSVGLYLCCLVIKPMQYFVKYQKMSKEEKVIENIKKCIRQRKSNIAAIAFIVILNIFVFVLLYLHEDNFNKTAEDIRLLNLTKLIGLEFFVLGLTGLMIGTLILEISGLNRDKHKLTLNMWERIQELENEVRELKSHTQDDNKN